VNARRSPMPLVLVVALLCAACGFGSPGSRGSNVESPNSKPSSAMPVPRQVQAVIRTDNGPSSFVVNSSGVFVANHRGGTIQRIDPETNRVTATTSVGGQLNFQDNVVADQTAWTCTNVDGYLHQIDLGSLRVIAHVPADCDGGWRTWINGKLWALPGRDTHYILVMDGSTGQVLHHVPLESTAEVWSPALLVAGRVIAATSEGVFVFDSTGNVVEQLPIKLYGLTAVGDQLFSVSDAGISELDPRTLSPVRTIAAPAPAPEGFALVGDRAGHLYYRPDYTHLYRVDLATAHTESVMTLPWEETPTGLAYAFDSLWVTNFDESTIWRVDPTSA
jgi:DNA-binding beta-propeller fold protein YncE